jgi:cytochrome c556
VRKRYIITSSLVLALGFGAWACSHQKSDSVSDGQQQPAHAAQGKHLRETMHQLAEKNAYSPTANLPPDPESDKKIAPKVFDDAAKFASGLAETASKITTSKRDKKLSDAERTAFDAEANNLRSRALDLQRAANEHKVEAMQRAFDGINSSCIACHNRFRDFAGQLDFGRAAVPERTGEMNSLATVRAR